MVIKLLSLNNRNWPISKYFCIQQFKKLLFYSVNIAVSQSTRTDKFQITA